MLTGCARLPSKVTTDNFGVDCQRLNCVSHVLPKHVNDQPIVAVAANHLRVGHWNIANFSGKLNSKGHNRNALLAQIITHLQYDILGVSEVNASNGNGLKNLVRELKLLQPNVDWRHLNSPILRSNLRSKYNQQERIGVLYNAHKVQLNTNTTNHQATKVYSNPVMAHHDFARPPFGVNFSAIKTDNFQFSLVFSHHDASGIKHYGRENLTPLVERETQAANYPQNTGSFEVFEAQQLVTAMQEFDQWNQTIKTLVYLGDTNIKAAAAKMAFEQLTLAGYQDLLGPQALTTIGNGFNRYANSYDKIFKKGPLQTSNALVYGLWSLVKEINPNHGLYQATQLQKLTGWSGSYQYLRNGISDHSPTFVDLGLAT